MFSVCWDQRLTMNDDQTDAAQRHQGIGPSNGEAGDLRQAEDRSDEGEARQGASQVWGRSFT